VQVSPLYVLVDTFVLVSDADLESLSYVFTARSSGYLVGSIISGWLFDRYRQMLDESTRVVDF
jgi:MFS family permease